LSELVALCFDSDASPRVEFSRSNASRVTVPGGPSGVYGWGIGWYPASERGAAVVKDPGSRHEEDIGGILGGWGRFRSTLFLGHLRGHRRRRSQQDLQPFVRSYAGRQWIFAHAGDLGRGWADRLPLLNDPSFEPLGRTDSEHAFCWLLSRLHERRARSLGDVPAEDLRGWLLQLNAGGQLNVIVSDGDHLVAYRDSAHTTRSTGRGSSRPTQLTSSFPSR
jgi:predicted glutamine amidotransferase